jgi:hypothetical protein
VSNPTETHPPDPASWRLVLDEGEQLDVRLIPSSEPSGRADVEVRMSAMRADDLSRVLGGYSRIAAIMSETSEVSSTEGSLARGLRDAAAVARGPRSEPVPPTRIGSAQRLKAMAVLQQARPDLSHTKLMAVVDAAAWWLTDDEDSMAMDLLDAVTPDAGSTAYFTLLGRDKPGSAPAVEAGPG